MPCEVVSVPGVGSAIVCTSGRRRRCKCGGRATRLCDWKKPRKRSGTCDEPLCIRCSTSPASEKDLCPAHAAEWEARKAGPPETLFPDQAELPV